MATRPLEIPPREQQQEIAMAHFDRSTILFGRPCKCALLEPFVQDPKPGVIPDQDLQSVAASIANKIVASLKPHTSLARYLRSTGSLIAAEDPSWSMRDAYTGVIVVG